MEVNTYYNFYSIGKEQRDNFHKAQGGPGPGAYGTHYNIAKSSPRYTMAGRHNRSGLESSPGPGQYQPKFDSKLKKTTFGYSMGGRNESASARHSTPGPGAYDIASHKDRKQGAFGRAGSRESHKVSASPGPGAYTVRNSSSRHTSAPKFSFGGKKSMSLNNTGPGPGSYEVKSVVGREGSKHTITPRRPMSAKVGKNRDPGPGAYNVTTTNTGPKYRIGTAPKCQLLKEFVKVPGPGTYNPDDKTKSIHRDAPHWKMGTASKGTGGVTERTPGPGSYNIKERIGEGPSYAIRPKTAVTSSTKGSPGPGQYNPQINDKRPPTAVMGREIRGSDFSTSRHVPGPGAYMYSRELT